MVVDIEENGGGPFGGKRIGENMNGKGVLEGGGDGGGGWVAELQH